MIGAEYQIRCSTDSLIIMVCEGDRGGTLGSLLFKIATGACQILKLPFDAAPTSLKKDNTLDNLKQELKTLPKRKMCQHLKNITQSNTRAVFQAGVRAKTAFGIYFYVPNVANVVLKNRRIHHRRPIWRVSYVVVGKTRDGNAIGRQPLLEVQNI
ncbi:hypothetical protein Trydic_g1790 [Trypoxylus dichotomus]